MVYGEAYGFSSPVMRENWGLRADEQGWGRGVRQLLGVEGGQRGDCETSLPQSPVFVFGNGAPWSRALQGHLIS